MITDRQLATIAPNCPRALRAKVLPLLQEIMGANAINTRTRAAAFIANLCVESGEFKYTEEIWGNTPAQRRYDVGQKALDLGNTPAADGDGKYRKGYGWIQTTGGKNQRRVLRHLGLDPEQDPKILGTYPYCGLSAAFYWKDANCNKIADQLSGTWDATERSVFKRLVKAINGGTMHLAEREEYYRRAVNVLRTIPGFGRPPEGAPPVVPPAVESAAPPKPDTVTVSNGDAESRARQTKVIDYFAQQVTPDAAKGLAASTAGRAKGPLARLSAWLVASLSAGDASTILGLLVAAAGLAWILYHYRRQIRAHVYYFFSKVKGQLV